MAAPLTGNLMIDAADFDLTGQLVWPGAVLMNNYLSQHPEIVKGCSVVELGSGIGERIHCRAPSSLWSYES
jgi:predicted nicotinamide N-methyase